MPRATEAARRAYCTGCRRVRPIIAHNLCSSCAESRRRYGGPRSCSFCGKETYQNHMSQPSVMCLDCFHQDLVAIHAHYLHRTPFLGIAKFVRLSRRTIRIYCQYFSGLRALPRNNFAPETVRLLNQLQQSIRSLRAS